MPRCCEEFKADVVEKMMPPKAREVADVNPQFRNARAQALTPGGIDVTRFAERAQGVGLSLHRVQRRGVGHAPSLGLH